MFIDTHSHIYSEEFSQDLDAVITNAHTNGVYKILMPNIDSTSIDPLHDVRDTYPQCYPMMGLHPCYIKEDYKQQLSVMENLFANNKYIGVGEIGIDLYWDKTFVEEQMLAFTTQLSWAREMRLPVSIHSRDALDITIKEVSKLQNGNITGVFHCFNGSEDQAKQIIDIGLFLGIGGVITYKNAGVAEVVQKLPLESMVLETDAPYLSPVPYRGKRNESAYCRVVAEKLAEIFEEKIEHIGAVTTNNAEKIFFQNN